MKVETFEQHRKISCAEKQLYRELFPVVEKVEDYERLPVPKRVLYVIKRAETLGIYDELEFRSEQLSVSTGTAGLKPRNYLLTGIMKNSQDEYLLARWGAEPETFEILRNTDCVNT